MMVQSWAMGTLVLLSIYLTGVVSLALDDLYPYPHDNVVTADDQLLYRNDDGSSPAITFSFPYFNSVQTTAHVNTNGDVTFGNTLSDYTQSAFPINDPAYLMIAPFWTDIITTQVGQIWYKFSINSDLLARAASDVQATFSDQQDFNPSMIFVVTWHEVPQVGTTGSLRNTFQIVLTTDGTKSFVMLHYFRLEWAGDAMVGFNAGDGVNSYTVNGSLSYDVINLVTRSNVGIPGKFFFRVDGVEIQPADQEINIGDTSEYHKAVLKGSVLRKEYVLYLKYIWRRVPKTIGRLMC